MIWGDLTDYEDVKEALRGVDIILHVAALVSPAADKNPELAWAVNVGSMENILRAVEELGLADVKLVSIGSVAETGSRLPPYHWGRVGDPIKPSVFDHYAATKIAAERLVIESGLKYWVSLRQTGILHYGLVDTRDDIIFHHPLNNVLEWVTEDDSGRLLANLCVKDLPESFWKNVYNIGGGESCRLNNYDFTSKLLRTVGVRNIRKIFEPNWFATKNFHGQYYLDSDVLNDYLDFRRESFDGFLKRLKKQMGYPTKLLKYLLPVVIKHFVMKPIAENPNGSLSWIRTRQADKTEAFWGSTKDWRMIKTWKSYVLADDYDEVRLLDHGYDEGKADEALGIEDVRSAAEFRGGKCLSASMETGNLDEKLAWECAFSHRFWASPRLVLKTGHWCEVCEAPPWNYAEIAKVNAFLAQVYGC